MTDVVITAARRTRVAAFLGSDTPASELGRIAIKAAMADAGVSGGGKQRSDLAGTGVHSYSPGDTTGGSATPRDSSRPKARQCGLLLEQLV